VSPVSASAGLATRSPRRRNAADSRERLLQAAQEVFSERGYDRATLREVGQRAQVDPAMIARYFGGKAALYLESLRRDQPASSAEPLDLTSFEEVQGLLDRVDARGATPTLHAAVRPHSDAELQSAAIAVLERRMVEPSRERASQVDAQLRAEMLTAALAGILLSRASGAFATLSAAPSADVARLITELSVALLKQGPVSERDVRS
jgi:AcrR family transcriptional regulator